MTIGDEIILVEDDDANGEFTGKELKALVVAQPVADDDEDGLQQGSWDGKLFPVQDTEPSKGMWVKFLGEEYSEAPICQLVEDGDLWANFQYGGGYEYYRLKT